VLHLIISNISIRLSFCIFPPAAIAGIAPAVRLFIPKTAVPLAFTPWGGSH